MPQTQVSESEWRDLADQHRRRAERWTLPAKARHARGLPHPVEDFLFSYYGFSFGKLEQWHPAFGTALEFVAAIPKHFSRSPYRQQDGHLFADPDDLSPKARARLVWIRDLLSRTRDRKPNHACHGIHEWAMVYRGTQVRHQSVLPLRLPQAQIDSIVENHPLACSHFDAFRFFHPEAQAHNPLQPTLETRSDLEQPACVHANMDLYKWASRSMPWIGSDLLIDCFELALQLRELDMRASPYELRGFDLTPVRIETDDGRSEYERLQRRLADRAAPLRQRLIDSLDRLITSWDGAVLP